MISTSFWLLIVCSAAFFLLSIHPFILYPASLWLLKKIRGKQPAPPGGETPSFSICVCAYNEESVIAAKAENMLALAKTVPNCELLIYVDGASDRTAERLQPYADQIRVVVGPERRGKSYGMNLLVARARGDVVVFSDANVMLDPEALRAIGPRFTDPKVGCVCGQLIYSNADESAMASSGSLYWRVEEAIKRLESDAYSVIGADGSLFAIRRSLHHPVPDDIIDDFYVSMKILIDGYRVVSEPKALAFERSATNTYDEFRRKIRIACQAFNVHRLIWPEVRRHPMLAYCYVSHRFLKWIIGYNLLLAVAFFLAAMLLVFSAVTVIAGVLIVVGAFAAMLALNLGIAQQVLAILVSFAGAAWGVWRSIRGDRFQTWTPPASARVTGPK